jgi:hypothetical protein
MLFHILVPALVARLAYPARWRYAWLIMLGTMVIDLDHLLATPIYNPRRCSIDLHPLHTWPAIVLYLGLTVCSRTRLAGTGLLIHMVLDTIDCVWMAVE